MNTTANQHVIIDLTEETSSISEQVRADDSVATATKGPKKRRRRRRKRPNKRRKRERARATAQSNEDDEEWIRFAKRRRTERYPSEDLCTDPSSSSLVHTGVGGEAIGDSHRHGHGHSQNRNHNHAWKQFECQISTVYVDNVPKDTDIRELVKFLEDTIRSILPLSVMVHILRCELYIRGYRGTKTYAVIHVHCTMTGPPPWARLGPEQLTFQGTCLSVRPTNRPSSSSSYEYNSESSSMGRPGTTVETIRAPLECFQVVHEEATTPSEFHSNTSSSHGGPRLLVSFKTSKSSPRAILDRYGSTLRIYFKYNDSEGGRTFRLTFPLKSVIGGRMFTEKTSHDGNEKCIALIFRCDRSPDIHKEDPSPNFPHNPPKVWLSKRAGGGEFFDGVTIYSTEEDLAFAQSPDPSGTDGAFANGNTFRLVFCCQSDMAKEFHKALAQLNLVPRHSFLRPEAVRTQNSISYVQSRYKYAHHVFDGLCARANLKEWKVLYALACLLSSHKLSKLTLDLSFLEKLARLEPNVATAALLRWLEVEDKTYSSNFSSSFTHNKSPMCLLDGFVAEVNQEDLEEEDEVEENDNQFGEEELASLHILVQRVIVTPTRIICLPPEIDRANRILRTFHKCRNRFVRVSFASEDMGHMSLSGEKILQSRVLGIMTDGFSLMGRRFRYLAFSNSQLRDHGCWFYADPTPQEYNNDVDNNTLLLNRDEIRMQMGDTKDIKVIGKHAARLGQCFSSTVDTVELRRDEWIEIEDIKRNGYCFSDGIGVISKELASRVEELLDLPDMHKSPSAYQIRFGGCKGMVAVGNPEQGHSLVVRKSMKKFESSHSNLEVCDYSKVLPIYLNKQLIAILSSLGIDDSIFLEIQANELHVLEHMYDNNESAIATLARIGAVPRSSNYANYSQLNLEKIVSSLGSTFVQAITDVIKKGYDIRKDPFFQRVLSAIRRNLLVEMRTRARYLVENGANLIGILDETGHLSSDEICVNLDTEYEQEPNPYPDLTGKRVLVGRNPSLHPGDIRILTVVQHKELQHLRNCIVFSQNGHRPQPNMMSGGDLDGDLYFVIWDERLIPRTVAKPMDFDQANVSIPTTSLSSSSLGVSADDEARFFVNYMKNDNLGIIANAHLVHYDKSTYGVFSKECRALAKLHSTAVDFCKTGVPAEISHELRVREYPDFMEKKSVRSYESQKVLGQLYRNIKHRQMFGFSERNGIALEVDKTFLVPGYEFFLVYASEVLEYYRDALFSIMCRFDVSSEGELVSGRVAQFSRKASRKGRQEKVQESLNLSLKDLREEVIFRFWCIVQPETRKFDEKQKYERSLQLSSSIYFHAYTSNRSFGVSCPWIFYKLLLLGQQSVIKK